VPELNSYKTDSAHLFGVLVTSARGKIQGEEPKKKSYNMQKPEIGRIKNRSFSWMVGISVVLKQKKQVPCPTSSSPTHAKTLTSPRRSLTPLRTTILILGITGRASRKAKIGSGKSIVALASGISGKK